MKTNQKGDKMKKVIIEDQGDIVKLDNLPNSVEIFAMRDDKLVGMVIKTDEGWMLSLGGEIGWSGHWRKRRDCMLDAEGDGFTFHIP